MLHDVGCPILEAILGNGRRPQPAVPVKFRWRLRGFQRRACGARINATSDALQSAQPSVADHRNCFDELPATALLRANLEYRSRTLLHLPDQLSFLDRQRHRFFAVHVFAGQHRLGGNFCVPMIWRHDVHHINGLIINDFPIITALVNRSARPLPHNIACSCYTGTINITHRDDIAKLWKLFSKPIIGIWNHHSLVPPKSASNNANRRPLIG